MNGKLEWSGAVASNCVFLLSDLVWGFTCHQSTGLGHSEQKGRERASG